MTNHICSAHTPFSIASEFKRASYTQKMNTQHMPVISDRYEELIDAYKHLHEHGTEDVPAAATFPGQSLIEHIGPLADLVTRFKIRSLIDYGCGKGLLYRPVNRISLKDGRSGSCLQELLGVTAVLYDPAYLPYSEKPELPADLVVCTDVLEHCAEEDIAWIVDDLFRLANRFVYANIACYPASKHLPNGANAHVTVQPPDWWREIVAHVAARHPSVRYRFVCASANSAAGERQTEIIEN